MDKHSLVEDDLLNYSGKWGILDENGELLIPHTYSYVDFFRNEKEFLVARGKFDFIYVGEDYVSYIARGVKWGVINDQNEIIIPIEYDWIVELESNLYAINSGGELKYSDEYQDEGWYVNNGVWGVKNSRNETIVPIEYNSFYMSWGQIRNMIFVQKGKHYFNDKEPYNGFDLEGNLIYKNQKGRIPEEYRHFPGK